MDLQEHPLEGKQCEREEEVQGVHLFQTSQKTMVLDIEDMKTAWPSVPSTLTFGEFQ